MLSNYEFIPCSFELLCFNFIGPALMLIFNKFQSLFRQDDDDHAFHSDDINRERQLRAVN